MPFNAQQAFVSTYRGALAGGVCANMTFSFAITAGYDAFVPVVIKTSHQMSFSPEVWVYRSADGGASWESAGEGTLSTVFPLNTAAADKTAGISRCIALTTGQYLVRVITGSGTAATYTVSLETAYVISAILDT